MVVMMMVRGMMAMVMAAMVSTVMPAVMAATMVTAAVTTAGHDSIRHQKDACTDDRHTRKQTNPTSNHGWLSPR
jgi:hypothetical protein